MKVSDPNFILEKIDKYLKEDIFPSRRRETQPVKDWKYTEQPMDNRFLEEGRPAPENFAATGYDDSNWQDFAAPGQWGGYDKVAWFRAKAAVPESWRKSDGWVAMCILAGPRDGGDSTAEGLLYVNGSPVQAVDIWHEEALLDESVYQNGGMDLALKVWSGVLGTPEKRRFAVADLVLLDPWADRFYYKADTWLRCARMLPEGDLRRIAITKALNRAFACVNFLNYCSEEYYASLKLACTILEQEMKALENDAELKPSVAAVGHSHIDMAWLWRLGATREKASRTFATVLNLMRQYPEYKFMHSSPQLYKFLQQDHPEIFARVKEKIEAGQWEISGGMWVEPDTNIPSGESLVRQLVYGQRYIRETFGKNSELVWLPDVFGYSAALPQIMKKSGIKYFMTTKISWNQYNHFPYDTFFWKGLDGSSVLTHFITTPEDGSWYYTYNGQISPEETVGIWKNYKNKDKNSDLLLAYGWGDGGGGPTREQIESALALKNVPGIPFVRTEHAEPYFQKLAKHSVNEKLDVWEGELYFEFHRGTYTSQGQIKRDNRKTEFWLHDVEALNSMSGILNKGGGYPKQQLDDLWERTLLLQFHDVLPGSSIRQVYEDAQTDHANIMAKAKTLCTAALENLVTAGEGFAAINTNGVAYNGTALLPAGSKVPALNGEVLPWQDTADGVLVQLANVPSYGWQQLEAAEKPAKTPASPFILSEKAIETPYYSIALNENGEIEGLFDKRMGRQLATGAMNRFVAYEDKPQRFDAWDIDIYYREKPYPPFTFTGAKVLENGPLRAVLELSWTFNKSTVSQRLTVYAHSPRIDFVTQADWKEEQVLWKVYFPLAVHTDKATYEIQFGNIERSTHTNTEYDFAKFETCGHKWADISEESFGVALLNDSKYGHDIHDGALSMTLIKSALRPDETADRRQHNFTYSLLPHSGSWSNGGVQEEALALNHPAFLVAGKAAEQRFSLVSTKQDNIMLDTVKKCEDEEAWIVRFYEYKNRSLPAAEIAFGFDVVRAAECDLLENEIAPAVVENGKLTCPLGCYEIKTFKLYTK